ncbi:DNA primase [Buchnera aphidicola]|uniref:DNA primase n=1 Tax=Buchnera aphidicola TaxID=9 RepID=UPI003463A66C
MHTFIPQHFIKEILDEIDIVDIIKQRIQLNKHGNNYHALCPFHNETKPSFVINHEKQYFYCFGCNIYGNAIDFIMKYDQLKFIESIQELTRILGKKIPNNYFDLKKKKQYYYKNQFYKDIKIIVNIYHNNIHTNHGKIAKCYLKNRKINNTMINYFQIGFSSNQENFLNQIIHNNSIHENTKNNIFIKIKNNKQYNQFYNRIIFPIQNQYGNTVGFGGRSLINNKYPKYINSPTTEFFNKSKELYGIEKIKKKNIEIKYILVVEGYFDVISLTQFNIQNVVSTLGTMITKYQIQILFQITNNILYCYDGDKSGKQASWRTLKNTLPYLYHNRNIRFIFLPDQEDPDSIIHKEGKHSFFKRMKNSTSMIDFFFMKLCKRINLSTIEGKNKLLNKSIPLIQKIPNTFLQMYLKKKIGEKIGIIEEYQLHKIFYNQKKYYNKKKIKLNKMRILINLIIKIPKLYNIIPYSIQELQKIKICGLPLFIEIFNICKIFKKITTGQLIEFYRKKKKLFHIIKKIIFLDHMIEKKKINFVFVELIINLYKLILEKKYNNLITKDRIKKLDKKEKYILWKINKTLQKK